MENLSVFWRGGTYYWWKNNISIQIAKVDMRSLQLEISGQEILTKDKANLRLNFFVQYRIADIVKAVFDNKDYEKQLHILMQLALREYIGGLTLDELLEKKDSIGQYVLENTAEKVMALGIEIKNCGVRDVILPGDMKEIMNQVLMAEKKAQANVIMRKKGEGGGGGGGGEKREKGEKKKGGEGKKRKGKGKKKGEKGRGGEKENRRRKGRGGGAQKGGEREREREKEEKKKEEEGTQTGAYQKGEREKRKRKEGGKAGKRLRNNRRGGGEEKTEKREKGGEVERGLLRGYSLSAPRIGGWLWCLKPTLQPKAKKKGGRKGS
ncbi:MAG: slipin family protein [Arcicella sp.]|nr:slipin family protein [Arcicella sp.]